MPFQWCPACGQLNPRRRLDFSSDGADVNYYRCDCGHIWTVNKGTGQVTHVTPLITNKRQPGQ
jgi:hypothetical protein